MKWIKAKDDTPMPGVDVFVKTKGGKIGVAKYWDLTEQWFTADERLSGHGVVVKWKYAEAT